MRWGGDGEAVQPELALTTTPSYYETTNLTPTLQEKTLRAEDCPRRQGRFLQFQSTYMLVYR